MAQTYEDKPTLAAWNALAGSGGNCKIVWDHYYGTGLCGYNNRVRLTFDSEPLLLIVRPRDQTMVGDVNAGMVVVRNCTWSMPWTASYQQVVRVIWDQNTVSWYHDTNATFMLNDTAYDYYYIALLKADT